MTSSPPRMARALVSFATELADRPWILADLEEEFSALAATNLRVARRWYWRQAVTSLLPLTARRFRRRPASPVHPRPDMLSGLRSELRHALRVALRTPAPTTAILLTMALGIGAVAAVSTVVWKVLLQPLPVVRPERVLAVYRVVEGTGAVIPLGRVSRPGGLAATGHEPQRHRTLTSRARYDRRSSSWAERSRSS